MYTETEIQETIKMIQSLIKRCEKAQLKFTEGTSQHSLLKNRIKALHVSLSLISYEDIYSREDIEKALAPIESIIHKTSVGMKKHDESSPTYKRMKLIVDAMIVCKIHIENSLYLSKK